MPELRLTSTLIQQALGAQATGRDDTEQSYAGVSTDSRQVKAGEVFVCLKGERFDAHDFAADVVKAGASALVVSRPLDLAVPQYVVPDTTKALGAIAAAWRAQFKLPVLAVVGSNGKTTSKEMLASICRTHHGEDAVLVTQGNLNNEIGVPLTLLRLNTRHRAAVVEMGMNHEGEIAYLASLVKPDVVLLTNAQREHQEFMKTVEAVARENGSAFEWLATAGTAVFPANSPYREVWLSQNRGSSASEFGQGGAVSVVAGDNPAELACVTPSGVATFKPKFMGEHNHQNAAGAAAAALAGGCTLHDVVNGLESFTPVWGRLEIVLRTPSLTLINDAYNANPDSVNAASQVLASLPKPTLLVLGDMGEVGDQSDEYHTEVGLVASQLGIANLYALGKATRHTVSAFGAGAEHFDNIDDLNNAVINTLQKGQWTVLVKGSRFMKMERVVNAIKAQYQPAGETNYVA